VGALAILVWRRPSARSLDAALGLRRRRHAHGLLHQPDPARASRSAACGRWSSGIVLGALVLDRADVWVPHIHVLVTGRRRADAAPGGAGDRRVAGVILFIVAITLHNMPEGLAVGVAFGGGAVARRDHADAGDRHAELPEGLAVAVAARNAGMGGRWYAAFTGFRAGLVEVPLAVLGAWAVAQAAPLLPYAMGFAAGGMLFVISDEIIPETHARGHERLATLGTMIGVLVMLVLDVALG
jgi:zinc transporter, ZIP family